MKKKNLPTSNYNFELDKYSKQILFVEQVSNATKALHKVGTPK